MHGNILNWKGIMSRGCRVQF